MPEVLGVPGLLPRTATTWRDSAGDIDFSTAIWPAPTAGETSQPASGDVTRWTYQPATGLLTRKEYADGNGTDYSYDSANRLAVRTWARSGGLDSAYSYDANTAELTAVDYEELKNTHNGLLRDRLIE